MARRVSFGVAKKEKVTQYPSYLTSGMRPYTPSTEHGNDATLEYMAEREIMQNRWESIKRARKKERCVEEAAREKCLRPRMKQKLSGMVGVGKRAAREELFSLTGYDLIKRRTTAENGTEYRN